MEKFDLLQEYSVRLPSSSQTALDTPSGYLTLYYEFFYSGNFRIPVTKFFVSLLGAYGVHISQMNALGVMRMRHFEFVCRAHNIEPHASMFNVFYRMTCQAGFYSFAHRSTKVNPVASVPPRSLHHWKSKFFFIRTGVIPVRMVWRTPKSAQPDIPAIRYEGTRWYLTLTAEPSRLERFRESSLVAAGMSRIWDKADRVSIYKVDDRGTCANFVNILL